MLSETLFKALSPLFINKIKDHLLKKNIKKTFQETFSKSKHVEILDALALNSDFNDAISELGENRIVDGQNLLALSIQISKKDNLNLSRIEIIKALKELAINLLNFFAAKNPELGKTPVTIQNFFNSMDRLSSMPDCFSALLEEKIKDAGYSDLEAKLRQVEKNYEELQASVAKRDKEDNLAPEIQKNLDACKFGEAEKLLLQSFDKNLQYTKNAAEDAFQLAKLKQIQLEYDKAKKYYKEAVRLSPNNSLYLNNLGYILYELGKYNEAINYFQKALDIDLKTFGKNHPNIAIRYNNIGLALRELGKYKKALDYYKKALDIDLKTLGDDHPNTARDFNNTGAALKALSEYSKAIKYYKKALDIDLKTFGKNHPNTARDFNNIGAVLRELGEYKKAIDYFQKALDIDLKTLGDDHPNTATTLNNIGAAYYSLCEYNKAIEYYEKALKIFKNILGENHPNIAATYNNIGTASRELGNYKKALECLQKALDIDLKTFENNHPNTATDFNNIGTAYYSSGDYNNAIDYYKKAKKICMQSLGADHPHTKIVKNHIEIAKQALMRKQRRF